jgi:hypothetical protein
MTSNQICRGDWNSYQYRGNSTWEQMKDAVRDAWIASPAIVRHTHDSSSAGLWETTVVTNRSIPRCADFSRKCCSLAGVRSKASMVPGTKPRRTRASCNANVTAPVSQPAFSTLRSERSNRDCSKIARRPCGRASLSHDAGRTLVHEGHRLWTLHVTSLQPIDPKACRRNQLVNRPVEMTAAADSFPDWCQRVLPT